MDIQELKTIAQLASLNMSEEELAAVLPAFEQMLVFFDTMNEADAATFQQDESPSLTEPLVGAEHFRSDEIKTNTAESEGFYFEIPGVL